MSGSDLPPFIKWSAYKSTDEKKPDILELKVIGNDTFETEYSTNVVAYLKVGKHWEKWAVPLKSHNSNNGSLLRLWLEGVQSGLVKAGKTLKLKTWLGTSKNDRTIRRFLLEKS